MIKERCFQDFSPGKDVSINESLVLFKGKLWFQWYIKSKWARFSTKLYDFSTHNGILLDSIVYHGKLTPQHITMEEGTLTTEGIPIPLTESYFGKCHNLYLDSFYTSLILANYLVENREKVTGTIRENEKSFLLELKNTILWKEEAAFYQHDNIVIVKYRTKRDSAAGNP